MIADLAGPPGPLGRRVPGRGAHRHLVGGRGAQGPRERRLPRAAGRGPGAGRGGPGWAVFTVADGRARLRPVEPGHRTAAEVEILTGIAAGERVVLHPPNELRDGVRVATR